MSASVAVRGSGPAARALAAVTASKLDGFAPELIAVSEPPADSMALADLVRGPDRPDRLASISAAAGPGAPRQLPVVWELEAVAWFVGALVGGPLLAAETLVAADPSSTWVRIGADGLADGLAVDERTPCLRAPEGAATVAGRAHATVKALIAPLIAGVARPRSRVLWWHAGDRIADAVLFCGQAGGDRPGALRLARELIEAEVPWRVPIASEDGLSRTRRTCCLSRRLEPAVMCEGCPHERRTA